MPTDSSPAGGILRTTPPQGDNRDRNDLAPSEISCEPICSFCDEIFKQGCATFVVHRDAQQIVITRRDREFGIAQRKDPEILTICSLACLLIYLALCFGDDPGSCPNPINPADRQAAIMEFNLEQPA